jgi:hypothetical protein
MKSTGPAYLHGFGGETLLETDLGVSSPTE